MQGKNRAVIIIPEGAVNPGWLDLANKVEKFIYHKRPKAVPMQHRLIEQGVLFADTIRRSKWSSREMNKALITEKDNTIVIKEGPSSSWNEFLSSLETYSLFAQAFGRLKMFIFFKKCLF